MNNSAVSGSQSIAESEEVDLTSSVTYKLTNSTETGKQTIKAEICLEWEPEMMTIFTAVGIACCSDGCICHDRICLSVCPSVLRHIPVFCRDE